LGLQGATEVYLAPTIIPITNVKQIFNNSISLHTFVLKELNECIAFGSNEYYQCGFHGQGPERVILQNPFKIVDYVTLGYNFSIMVLKDAHSSIPVENVKRFSDLSINCY
jgi:alpha-tubulin suppressor-like RCC1 family protein